MDYCKNVQKSIDYIEEHLKDDINVNSVVLQSGYSTTHFYRIFQALVGESVKDYIRKRKLSDAAVEMSSSQNRLIDIAFEYGYNSQEVFTRAFSKLFGTTPGKYRKLGNTLVLFEKVNTNEKLIMNKRNLIVPIILEKEFRIVGIKNRVKPGNQLIYDLWNEFNIRRNEISHETEQDNSLGICEYMPDITNESEFDYIASAEVSDFCNIPEGMIAKDIVSTKYAVFAHKGNMKELKTTYDNIYGAWLPSSGYELAEMDTIEIYHLNAAGSDSMLDIYIPIK